MMQDLALPWTDPPAAERNCKKAGNDSPHQPAVVASQLRRETLRTQRVMHRDWVSEDIRRSTGRAFWQ